MRWKTRAGTRPTINICFFSLATSYIHGKVIHYEKHIFSSLGHDISQFFKKSLVPTRTLVGVKRSISIVRDGYTKSPNRAGCVCMCVCVWRGGVAYESMYVYVFWGTEGPRASVGETDSPLLRAVDWYWKWVISTSVTCQRRSIKWEVLFFTFELVCLFLYVNLRYDPWSRNTWSQGSKGRTPLQDNT